MPDEVRRLVEWRGAFANDEVNALHAEAFGHRTYSAEEWDWVTLVASHSLGWVVAREGGRLVGFLNVPWDGLVHAWIQDVMVATAHRRRGIGEQLVAVARDEAQRAGCEWLHVDFDPELERFYRACGFTPTGAGLIALQGDRTTPAPPPVAPADPPPQPGTPRPARGRG